MARITLKGNPIHTCGDLPAIGAAAPDFTLTGADLADVSLAAFAGKKAVLNIFPSLDTAVCAMSVRRFNAEAAARKDAVVLCVSRDLPFAHKRFCAAEGLDKVVTLSEMRSPKFGEDYGVRIVDGPLAGLLSRAVVIIGADGKVAYTQQVPEIAQEPDYEAALRAL
ncbi:MAG: thiol peroxidase [Nitrospinae bacterium]|nr:thiol peroxidase [Nitrospinota bacterium]